MRAAGRVVTLPLGLILALLASTGSEAGAVEVFFNGVRVTGLKDQTFQGCTVQFDSSGQVHITAQGYTVKQVEAADSGEATRSARRGSEPQPAAPQKRYFLVSAFAKQGFAQFDVDVYLNGKWLRKVRNSEGQVILDITDKLRPGKTLVQFAATKNLGGGPRLASSAEHYLKVLVGEGTAGGGTVAITRTLVEFSATADKTSSHGHAATLVLP